MANIETPRIWTGDVVSAHQAALDAREPLFLPVSVFADDRGWSIMNQLQGVLHPEGQVNYTVQYPGIVKAWHRHARQTDFWLCVMGNIKVGVYSEEDNRMWSLVFGEKRPGILVVPPPVWHGAVAVAQQPAGLLYYVTHAYDPAAPDEQRRAFDSVSGFSWEVVNR